MSTKEVNIAPDEESVRRFVRLLRINKILSASVSDEEVIKVFKNPKLLHYGDDDSPRGRNTVWGTAWLDVEASSDGKVVAVWFRCMPLPFKQHRVNKQRAEEMVDMYRQNSDAKLKAVEVEIEQPEHQA